MLRKGVMQGLDSYDTDRRSFAAIIWCGFQGHDVSRKLETACFVEIDALSDLLGRDQRGLGSDVSVCGRLSLSRLVMHLAFLTGLACPSGYFYKQALKCR